jgi:hypothetical protein
MMKTRSISTFALLLCAAVASAEVPSKAPVGRYSLLWEAGRSPFTTPKKEASAPRANPLEDWSLGGVSEITGGYMITLNHRKNAGETLVIRPDGVQKLLPDKVERLEPGAPGTFKLDRVEYGKGGWQDISVHLSAGSEVAVIRFDEDSIAPKRSDAPARPTASGLVKPVVLPENTKPNPPASEKYPRAVRVQEPELSK